MGFQATSGPPRRKTEKHRCKNMVVSVSSPPKDLYTLKAPKNNVKWAALLGCNDLQSDVLDGTPLCKYPEGGMDLQRSVLDGTPFCKHPESEFAFPSGLPSGRSLGKFPESNFDFPIGFPSNTSRPLNKHPEGDFDLSSGSQS